MVDASSAQERMDAVYRYQRHIYDVSRKYFLLGRDHLIASLLPPAQGHILEIGCGTARNLIATARAYPTTTCYGLDISRQMLATARVNVERADLADRIVLALADASGFDAEGLFDRPAFDRVFFSYSLSMMPPWRAALDQAARAVARGGRLQIVDFGQQERLPAWFKQLLFAWLDRFHVAPRADLEKALSLLAFERGGLSSFRPLYRGYAWYAEIGF
jgi:S-adenosylmethionine-diacylgycerolhomoserine-N-methlytransferase